MDFATKEIFKTIREHFGRQTDFARFFEYFSYERLRYALYALFLHRRTR